MIIYDFYFRSHLYFCKLTSIRDMDMYRLMFIRIEEKSNSKYDE